ncbi:hypothetical protein ACFV4G_25400 [Kitasatospora sp. NPDC059747]|uniref:hypothetical protein n=1 Tax=Kitasatospora sp. NPDC059747 TaxID=3346930 RepID=UPI003649CA9C
MSADQTAQHQREVEENTPMPSMNGGETNAFGPVVASIDGIMPEAEFDRLPDALAALLGEVDQLTVWAWHRDFIECGLGRPGAAGFIAGQVRRAGSWTLALYVGDLLEPAEPHMIRIRPAHTGGTETNAQASVQPSALG